MPNPLVTIELILRDKRFNTAMTRLQGVLKRTGASMQRVAQLARRMLLVSGAAVAGFLKLAADQEKAEARLAAVLKATGNAAEISMEQMLAHASAIQSLTTYGDEAVIALQAILATFKNIKGDVFRDATLAILDMAAVLDQDAKSGAIQLGKALNDPIIGITALTRVGVTFTQEQKDQIRVMSEAGRVMDAQRIILTELKSEFGGAAEAIAKTFGGKVAQLTGLLGDLGEQLGAVFVGSIGRVVDKLKEMTPGWIVWVKANKELILSYVKITASVLAFAAISPTLVTGVLGVTFAITGLITVLKAIGPLLVATKAGMAALGGGLITTALGAAVVSIGILIESLYRYKTAIGKVREELAQLDRVRASYYQSEWEAKRTLRKKDVSPEEQITALRTLIAVNRQLANTERQRAETFKPKGLTKPLGGMVYSREQEKRGVEHALRTAKKFDQIATDYENRMRALIAGKDVQPLAPADLTVDVSKYEEAAERVKRTLSGIGKAIGTDFVRNLQKQSQALDDEAAALRRSHMTAQERLKVELQRLDVLRAAGKLSEEEYREYQRQTKERYKTAAATQESIMGRFEGLTETYRRIAQAAAGKREDTQRKNLQQTAQNTGKLVQTSDRTARHAQETTTILRALLTHFEQTPQPIGVYG